MNFSAPQILNCEFTTVCVNTYHKNNDDGINTMPIRCLRHGIPRGKALPKVRNYIRIIDKTSWKEFRQYSTMQTAKAQYLYALL